MTPVVAQDISVIYLTLTFIVCLEFVEALITNGFGAFRYNRRILGRRSFFLTFKKLLSRWRRAVFQGKRF